MTLVAELTDADGVSPSKIEEKQQAQIKKLTEKVAMRKESIATEMTAAAMTAMREMVNANAVPFHVALSSEHVGFMFTKDLALAVRLLTKHSGGHNSQALQMYVASTLQKCFAPLFGGPMKDSKQHPL